MNLDFNSIIAYLACLIFIFIICKIFIIPIKILIKLLINSILGGVIIFIINMVGQYFNFHIGLNIITSVIVGILGIPGAILITIIKMII